MPLEVGQEAPDFTLKDPANEDVTLSSFRGRKNVVLVFFPLAFSGVCTKQLTQINQHGDRYAEGDAQVLGVSVDSRYVAGRLREGAGPDRRDPAGRLRAQGRGEPRVRHVQRGPGLLGRARTFVIDKQGIVQGVSLPDGPGEMPDEEEYFQTLAVCPVTGDPRELAAGGGDVGAAGAAHGRLQARLGEGVQEDLAAGRGSFRGRGPSVGLYSITLTWKRPSRSRPARRRASAAESLTPSRSRYSMKTRRPVRSQ